MAANILDSENDKVIKAFYDRFNVNLSSIPQELNDDFDSFKLPIIKNQRKTKKYVLWNDIWLQSQNPDKSKRIFIFFWRKSKDIQRLIETIRESFPYLNKKIYLDESTVIILDPHEMATEAIESNLWLAKSICNNCFIHSIDSARQIQQVQDIFNKRIYSKETVNIFDNYSFLVPKLTWDENELEFALKDMVYMLKKTGAKVMVTFSEITSTNNSLIISGSNKGHSFKVFWDKLNCPVVSYKFICMSIWEGRAVNYQKYIIT